MGLMPINVDSISNSLGTSFDFVTHWVIFLTWLLESTCFEKQHTHKIALLPGEDSSLYNFGSTLDDENTKLLIEKKSQHII